MIGRDREQDRDARAERVAGERELERRHLGDDHVDVVGDRVDQRPADVARRDRAHARRVEHRRDHRRHRRLAVRAGDRDDRQPSPARPRDRSRCAPGRRAPRAATSAGWSARTSGLGTTRSAAPTSVADRARRPAPRRARRRARAHRVDPVARTRALAPGASSTTVDVPALGAQRGASTATPVSAEPDHDARASLEVPVRAGAGSRRRRCRSPSATQMPANSQNRTMTVNSDQPPTSK